jgi:hypothetical protein
MPPVADPGGYRPKRAIVFRHETRSIRSTIAPYLSFAEPLEKL